MKEITYEQVRSDFIYLRKFGLPEDLCCMLCDTNAYLDVLTRKIPVKVALIRVIRQYFLRGYEDSERVEVNNRWLRADPRCIRIRARYAFFEAPAAFKQHLADLPEEEK